MSDDQRGNYRPLDRRQNPVINWGLQRAADHATWSAIGRAVAPVIPIVHKFDRANSVLAGARGVYTATRVIGGRDTPPLAHVGAQWFHGTQDRVLALGKIAAALADLSRDLMGEIAGRRDAAHGDPAKLAEVAADAKWLQIDIAPALTDWKAFVDRQNGGGVTLVATDWDVFENWLDRVRRLRQLARARGFHLSSPEPTDLPKTVWQRGAEGEGGLASWLGLLKIGIATAIGLAGAAGLYSALRGR